MIGVWTFRVCDGPWTLNAETAVCLPPCLRVGDAQTTNLSLPFRDFASPVLRTLLICPSVSAVGVSFARCFGAERGMALFRFLTSPFTGNNPPPVNVNGPADQPQDNAHHTPARLTLNSQAHGDLLDTNSGGNNVGFQRTGGGAGAVAPNSRIDSDQSPTTPAARKVSAAVQLHASSNNVPESVTRCVHSLVLSGMDAVGSGETAQEWSQGLRGISAADATQLFSLLDGSTDQRGAASVVQMLFTCASPTAVRVTEAIELSNVRQRIGPVDWYCSPSPSLGSAAVQNQPWETARNSAPVDRRGVQANPLITVGRLRDILATCEKTQAQWLVSRQVVQFQLVCVYVYHVGSGLLDGSTAVVAESAGLLVVAGLVAESCSTVQRFRSVGLELARATDLNLALVSFFLSVDSMLSPRDSTSFAEWVQCSLLPGETALAYLDRLTLLGSVQGRGAQDVFDRYRSALVVLEDRSDASAAESMAVVNLGSRLLHLTAETLLQSARQDPIFKMVPVAAKKVRHPFDRGDRDKENVSLPTDGGRVYQPSQAYNLYVFHDGCKTAGITDFGKPPPSGTHDLCTYCVFVGKDPSHTYNASVPTPRGKTCKHNPWRCKEIPGLAARCVATGKVTLDQVLQKIDNPQTVYESGRD